MSVKSLKRRAGRLIHRRTGLSFVTAMGLGKFIVTHDPHYTYEFPAKFEAFVYGIVLCTCCGPVGAELQGPKGSYDLSDLKSDLGDDLSVARRLRERRVVQVARRRAERVRGSLVADLAQARAKVKQLESELSELDKPTSS